MKVVLLMLLYRDLSGSEISELESGVFSPVSNLVSLYVLCDQRLLNEQGRANYF